MDRRIDALRVVASFLVVLLHVSATNIHEFGPKWWTANVLDAASRISVPLFFMIAGATLLRKQESLVAFFSKRVSRIALPLLFWSAFYLWWLDYNGVVTGNWALKILAGPTMFHLWYFYAIIGLYLFMPVMRRFYQGSTYSEKIFFLAVWFFVSSVYPTLQSLYVDKECGYLRLGVLADVYHLQYFGGYIGYLVLGAVLAERRNTVRGGLEIYAVATVGTILATYFLSRRLGSPCEFFFLYLSPLVVVAASGLFMAFQGMAAGTSSPWLRWISDCTLGIYCVHPIVIDPIFMRYGITNVMAGSWLNPLLVTLGVFGVSLALIFGLRLLKPLRFVM